MPIEKPATKFINKINGNSINENSGFKPLANIKTMTTTYQIIKSKIPEIDFANGKTILGTGDF